MTHRVPKRMRLASAVATVAVGLLAFGISSAVTSGTSPAFALSAGNGLGITGTVHTSYASGTCAGASATLFPGKRRCLLYTLTDRLHVPITVTAVTATVTGFAPAHTTPKLPLCKTSDVGIHAFTGTRVLPVGGTTTVGVPMELATDGTQDNCEGGTFQFDFHGTATYTDATTTTLASTRDPSATGRPVTLTAVVTPADPAPDPFGPNGAPDHAVAFYSCRTASCTSTTLLGTATLAVKTRKQKTAAASFTTGDLAGGNHYFEARYRGTTSSTPDFSGSHATMTQRVGER